MMTIFLKRHSKAELTKICTSYASKIGKDINKITVRDTKSRWGSCSSQGNISLSWRLLFAPRAVAEYVCAHEVSHLREMNHSASFWKLVAALSPLYEESRSWLKKNGQQLFKYGAG